MICAGTHVSVLKGGSLDTYILAWAFIYMCVLAIFMRAAKATWRDCADVQARLCPQLLNILALFTSQLVLTVHPESDKSSFIKDGNKKIGGYDHD